MMGPKPAGEDYPYAVRYSNDQETPMQKEVRRMLNEIDELRLTVMSWESHVCEHDYYGNSSDD